MRNELEAAELELQYKQRVKVGLDEGAKKTPWLHLLVAGVVIAALVTSLFPGATMTAGAVLFGTLVYGIHIQSLAKRDADRAWDDVRAAQDKVDLLRKLHAQAEPQEPKPAPASPMNAVEEAEEREWNKQIYAATKLVYGEPRYAGLFNKYPEERKRQHIEEVAGYVPEIWEIDKFIERLEQMPVDERAGYEAKAEFQLRRKGELLQKVYRELD